MKTGRQLCQLYRQSSLGHSVRCLRPAALLVFAFLSLVHESLHQSHQLLLCDVLAAETLLESRAAIVQRTGADKAGNVHHTT